MIKTKKGDIHTDQTTFLSTSADQTMAIGRHMATQFKPGTIVALYGQLGSGKTVLVKGFCTGLGTKSIVTSPSYTLMNIYSGSSQIFHFDFYRLDNETNWYELGLDEYLFGDGISFIEWPERLCDNLPENVVEISIFPVAPNTAENENLRRIIVKNFDMENFTLS